MVYNVQPDKVSISQEGMAPRSVHRAIDGIATVGIEVQILRRKLERGETIESGELDESLARIEQQLDGLSLVVTEIRDEPLH